MNYGKLSIVIYAYNAEKYLKECLNSVINQSYKNLEIILVNDCSTDHSQEIIDEYCKKDKRIKTVNNLKKKGKFLSKIIGSKEAKGDYLTFLNSEDYVSIDFYRSLIFNMLKNNSDIVMGNIVLELENNDKKVPSITDLNFEELNKNEIINRFFEQAGLNYAYHVTWNKIYKINLWKKALPHFEKVKECKNEEDFFISSVLFFYATKLTKIDNDSVFHRNDKKLITKNIDAQKLEEDIKSLTQSFNNVQNFLKEVKIYNKYQNDFKNWKQLYKNQYQEIINNCNLENSKESNNTKEKLGQLLNEFYDKNDIIPNKDFLQNYKLDWNDKLEEIKQAICNPSIKCVSFDIFDTLITRPFFEPKDLFSLLDDKFQLLIKNKGIEFSKLRIAAEKEARSEIKKEEVTLDEIYKVLNKNYGIENDILSTMKEMEIEYEKRFCKVRKTAFELYELANYLEKRVICTSDMYLPINVIKEMLRKNGYLKFDKIFLSSEERKTKYKTTLYKYMLETMKLSPNEVIHIGDNYDVDYIKAKNFGINAFYFRKASEIFLDRNVTNNLGQIYVKDLPDYVDNLASLYFLGIRSMIALVANKYFDNPYRPFNKNTDFNLDPKLIGYYALGMHLFGITKWLLDNCEVKNYDSIIFIARDGYLPMESFKILKQIYKNAPQEKYFYSSRKASIPFIIKEKLDFYKLTNFVFRKSPLEIIEILGDIVDVDMKKLTKLCEEKSIKLDEKIYDERIFYNFLSILANNFFDKEKQEKRIKVLKKYFEEIFTGKTCAFDVGYSARIEFYLSNLLNKKIDTYFININHEEAIKYAKMEDFELNTFYDYKPTITGIMRELLFSKCDPSCIGYKVDKEKEKVDLVFEDYKIDYLSKNIINTIQKEALNFVNDMVLTFDEDIFKLNYQKSYVSIPFETFIQSANDTDRKIFDCINIVESIIGATKKITIKEEWNKELNRKKQYDLEKLFDFQEYLDRDFIDLYGKNTLERFVYYAIFDKETFKDRIKKRFHKK